MKVVIVGGVAGGASAAARIRRLDEHAQIIMIERSGYVSYANCGLPYYVGGVIKEQEELTLQTPESFWDRFRIDVRVRQEVTAINPTEKTVTVHALDSGKVYTETYDNAPRTRRKADGSCAFRRQQRACFHAAHCGGYPPHQALC